MDRFINDISYIFTDMLFRILIQFIRVDWFSIFKDNVGLSDLWKMSFKNLTGIIHGDRYNGTTGFGCDFKCSVFKREKRKFFSAISCTLREDTDRNPLFDIFDGFQDRLKSLFWILPVKEKTIEKTHPNRKEGNFFHLFLCNISGQSFTAAVGKQNIKEAAMVSHVKNRFIRNIFRAWGGK